jgi:topoisomerase-4 subunit A
MHGNNGSIDNDACAAMRYTEARLSLYAECLINNIKKETVPFIENFDGGEMEPTILPALLPNLLINGSSGIAAGYATNIPPFNIIELLDCLIKKIDKPDASLETFLKILPGPDFPTGGIILNKKGVVDAYETGKGKINIRGEINLLNKKQAYITSIPYEVNKAELIDEINECASKYDTLGISECHDETDQKGISICINLKNSDNYELMKKFLLKHTQLQISYNFNMICIKDRKPCLIGLLSYFDTFLTYCEEIVLKYTKFDLNKAEKQKEIITGLIKAISILEDVIKLIRKSKDKADAMIQLETKYKFTKNQSESIVNLRLYRLSNTDVVALKNELEELEVQIKEYTSIINDQKYRNDYIKNIFKEYKKTFKDCKRKSMFSDEESEVEIDLSETIEDKEVFFVCTRDGYLKNVSMKSFENNTYEEIGLKESDIQVSQFLSNQKNKVVLVTNKGNFITIPVYKINQTK